MKLYTSLILLLPAMLFAQVDLGKMSRRKRAKWMAIEQIKVLHEGALLVRLKTKESTIEALNKIGKHARADRVKKEQRTVNQAIVDAFRSEFNFCKVFFFYSYSSVDVTNQDFDKVVFLNDSLQHDSSIHFQGGRFLTAEFGNISQDTTSYFDGYYDNDSKNGRETRSKYYRGADARFPALLIKSDKLIQLADPFPYYVRTYESLPITRSASSTVVKMNTKLQRYYKRKIIN